MSEEKNWGAEPWRAPTLAEGDVLLYSECGRVHKAGQFGQGNSGIDYRSHYFRVVNARGHAVLLVKHGGGEERIQLDYTARRIPFIFDPLDSDARYLLMHMLHSVHSDARRAASDSTAREYRLAFTSGRLKKRKVRGSQDVKVWIERAPQ